MIRVKKLIQVLVEIALLIGLVVALVGLFSSARGSQTATSLQPIAISSPGSPVAPTLVPATPSPPADDEFRPLPTINPYALPTSTPNPKSSPPTIDPTFSAMFNTAVPTGQPSPTPWPTPTPLSMLSASSNSPFSVQNLRFGPAVALNKELLDPFGDIAWSPDGQALAFSLYTGSWKAGGGWPATDIALTDVNGQNVQHLASGFSPLWSPDGNLIAYLDYSDTLDDMYIRIVDVNTKQNTLITTIRRGGEFPTLAWLSDTELVYFQDNVILFDYQTGQKSKLFDGVTPPLSGRSTRPMSALATAPKQGLIAAASGEALVILERSATGMHLLKQLNGVNYKGALSFSPDGSVLAYAANPTQQIKIVPARSDVPVVELPQAGRGPAWSIAWSPDGSSLVYADSDGVHLVNRDGSGLQKMEGLPQGTPHLAWSSRGTLALSANTSDVFFTFFNLPVSSAK
jgi:Tol biopolymer transport system component